MIINETGESTVPVDGIPVEVNKIIEQDLSKNPLPAGTERMYRVVINRNLTSPTEDAQVVRVIVKSQASPRPQAYYARQQSVMAPVVSVPAQQQSQQIHYILPSINQDQQTEQPHRYTPPPHKSVILPSANATSSRLSYHNDEEPPKKSKKRFSFFK